MNDDLSMEHVLPIQPAAYTRTAIILHWAVALLIFAAFPLGMYMHNLPLSPEKLRLFSYHKWMGITVLMLAAMRVAWRLIHCPPDLPATMPRWERFAALAMHDLLYVLIFAVPLSGWLMSSATGFQTVWFGVIPLPDLIGKDKELGRLLLELHERLNFLLIAVVGGHIAAALKHHFIAHDHILTHMIPFIRKSDPRFSVDSFPSTKCWRRYESASFWWWARIGRQARRTKSGGKRIRLMGIIKLGCQSQGTGATQSPLRQI